MDYLLLGFNFGDQKVCVADLSFTLREPSEMPVDGLTRLALPSDPAGRRIAILREPAVEKQPGHADPERLAKLLRETGFSPVFLRAADLCAPTRFNRSNVDLVILPNAPFFLVRRLRTSARI